MQLVDFGSDINSQLTEVLNVNLGHMTLLNREAMLKNYA